MCPFRVLLLALASCGVVWLGAWGFKPSGKGKDGKEIEEPPTKVKRFVQAWTVLLLVAFHADIFLQLGYTRCVFDALTFHSFKNVTTEIVYE